MRWILLLAVLSLDGCGFHLRGSGRSATQLDMLHVTAFNAYGELVQKLESVLTEAGVEIEPDKSVAPYSLRIISEKNTRRAATTTSRITVAEYELRLLVEFQIRRQCR